MLRLDTLATKQVHKAKDLLLLLGNQPKNMKVHVNLFLRANTIFGSRMIPIHRGTFYITDQAFGDLEFEVYAIIRHKDDEGVEHRHIQAMYVGDSWIAPMLNFDVVRDINHNPDGIDVAAAIKPMTVPQQYTYTADRAYVFDCDGKLYHSQLQLLAAQKQMDECGNQPLLANNVATAK